MAQVLDLSIPQIYDGLARETTNDDLAEPDYIDALHYAQLQPWTSYHCAATASPPSKSPLESLPAEIIDQILSHLVHPRSRLPGLTEAQSAHDFPRPTKLEIKNREDLTTLPDAQRWAADIFDFQSLRHPFHVLALTSRRLNAVVESYCGHLVRACNMFNLPFAHFDKYGAAHPDLSQIVYRRLWLQHAPRLCIYCHVGLDCYPFSAVKRLIAACEDCFYRQTLVRLHPTFPYIKTRLTQPDRRRSRAPVPHLDPHHRVLAPDPRPRPRLPLGPQSRRRSHGVPPLRHPRLPRRPRRPARQAVLHLRHHALRAAVLGEHAQRARAQTGYDEAGAEGR